MLIANGEVTLDECTFAQNFSPWSGGSLQVN